MLHSESRQVFNSVLFWFTIKRLTILHVLQITICAYLLKANRKIFLFCLFNSLGPASLVGKKEKVGWSAIFHFFFPRAFPRDFCSFVVSRHVVGASPMMKVGFHSQLRQVRKSGRDWSLEKLWGEGKFSSRRNFFRYQIPCMNFF